MNGQRAGLWKNRSTTAEQPKAPYIPQPDYTPLPVRRTESLKLPQRPQAHVVAKHPLPNKPTSVILPHPDSSNDLPRVDETRSKSLRSPTDVSSESSIDRVWHHPQWHSSQFLANDWSAALMKRLSVEAKSHREEKILREANKELERFESEIESYLEQVDEEEEDVKVDVIQKMPTTRMKVETEKSTTTTTSSGTSTPRSSSTVTGSPPCPSSPLSSLPRVQPQQHHPGGVAAASSVAPTTSNGTATSVSKQSGRSGSASSDGAGARRSRDRDQISLESGYMSSYPGDAQRHNGAF